MSAVSAGDAGALSWRAQRSRTATMKLAFFGTGLMGSGFVRRMLANGHDVSVWNRSPAKAHALQADRARAAAAERGCRAGAKPAGRRVSS